MLLDSAVRSHSRLAFAMHTTYSALPSYVASTATRTSEGIKRAQVAKRLRVLFGRANHCVASVVTPHDSQVTQKAL